MAETPQERLDGLYAEWRNSHTKTVYTLADTLVELWPSLSAELTALRAEVERLRAFTSRVERACWPAPIARSARELLSTLVCDKLGAAPDDDLPADPDWMASLGGVPATNFTSGTEFVGRPDLHRKGVEGVEGGEDDVLPGFRVGVFADGSVCLLQGDACVAVGWGYATRGRVRLLLSALADVAGPAGPAATTPPAGRTDTADGPGPAPPAPSPRPPEEPAV